MTISVITTVGTDTGEASYSTSGTVTNSSTITTSVGDVVFVFHSYLNQSPYFSVISCSVSGGTGSYVSGSGISSVYGNVASQSFYRVATVSETFKVTTTLASAVLNRRLFVAVLRSSTGTISFSSNATVPTNGFDPVAYPGLNSISTQSVPNNSIIIIGLSSQDTAPSFVAGSGYSLLSTSDTDVALYQLNSTATSTTPSFTNSATALRVRASGFIFYDSPNVPGNLFVPTTVGSDTGFASYASSGTTINSASVTTQVGDVVFAYISYLAPTSQPVAITMSGGTGTWVSGAPVENSAQNYAAQAFYRKATSAETFSVTGTFATSVSNKKITVSIVRSTTGSIDVV